MFWSPIRITNVSMYRHVRPPTLIPDSVQARALFGQQEVKTLCSRINGISVQFPLQVPRDMALPTGCESDRGERE
jgi:hypothetical protein